MLSASGPDRPSREEGTSGGDTLPLAIRFALAECRDLGPHHDPPDALAHLSGYEASLVFALLGADMTNSAAGWLADALDRASGFDCLRAAFSSARLGTRPQPFTDLDYFLAIGQWLGCRFEEEDALCASFQGMHAPSVDVRATGDGMILRYIGPDGPRMVIAPAQAWLPRLARLLCKNPEMRGRITVATPHAIVAAAQSGGPNVGAARVAPLHAVPDNEVADRVVSTAQVVVFALVLTGLSVVSLKVPAMMLAVTLLLVTAILIGYAASRCYALMADLSAATLPRQRLKSSELPVYTVLIPLYREARAISGLVRALRRLDYPVEKLDIQFLVEADDAETRDSILREARHLPCRIAILPKGLPKTKPRALNAGLRQARGSLVTIYDAEDRPDPGQLRLAAETFAAAPDSLAAVQARLCIDHENDNWLTRMFTIEYACLFDRLMPAIAARGRLILLGGTSNHFRAEALLAVGGWDPYNVTEDADLAVRLVRRGFRIGMIESDTFEESPLAVGAWIKQRSRWFKGYMQTWLVHNRAPLSLLRELGWRDTLVMHLFILGALTAAMAHNVVLLALLAALLGLLPVTFESPWLAVLHGSAAVMSYGVNFALGAVTIRDRRRRGLSPWLVLWFPVYWVLMGVAVAIGLYDLIRRPHHWRKTEHGVARRPGRVSAHAAGPAQFATATGPDRRPRRHRR
ncbi:glycosyltransferase family 2 protein [Acuticoccus sp. MNP-M23]|uniref:glycosyltransferase family 2 protein n=1 Tax=Acuticoccus sp. MNP-M23 TaxID=3072793 RepID=UPI0028155FF8|nr:glycosyltransferase family 2 protein [Acuticoccus sp. MNP-M23]WMS44258.1 glycosyltransferase family 2 protein [Acuticoccus sp. MNP-M23]